MRKCTSFYVLQKIFGFDDQANSGMIDLPIYQLAAGFYQAYPHLFKKTALSLVAYTIDQDPYFRLSNTISSNMNKKGKVKKLLHQFGSIFSPCTIIGKFIIPFAYNKNGVQSQECNTGKMSSSIDSTIFFTDTLKAIEH